MLYGYDCSQTLMHILRCTALMEHINNTIYIVSEHWPARCLVCGWEVKLRLVGLLPHTLELALVSSDMWVTIFKHGVFGLVPHILELRRTPKYSMAIPGFPRCIHTVLDL